MSQNFHAWFDGRCNLNVPLFKLDYVRHSDQPIASLDNRYEVVISVTAIDVAASKHIFPRLSSGSVAVEGDNLSMLTSVYVRDPNSIRDFLMELSACKVCNNAFKLPLLIES